MFSAVLITLSAPTDFEYARAFSEISVTTISFAPALLADKTQSVPIGPDPIINTFLPKILSTCLIACKQTARGSAMAASSGESPSAVIHCEDSAISFSLNAP